MPLSNQLARLVFISCCFLTPLPAPTVGEVTLKPQLRVSADCQIHFWGAATDVRNEKRQKLKTFELYTNEGVICLNCHALVRQDV